MTGSLTWQNQLLFDPGPAAPRPEKLDEGRVPVAFGPVTPGARSSPARTLWAAADVEEPGLGGRGPG